jgi:LPXTG-motif cell wall-anchored protein
MLRVSGVQTEQFFDVVAYRNETLQYTGSNSWWMTALAGLVFAIVAALIFFRTIQEPQWYEQVFFLILFSVGVILVFRGFYIKEAIDLLHQS